MFNSARETAQKALRLVKDLGHRVGRIERAIDHSQREVVAEFETGYNILREAAVPVLVYRETENRQYPAEEGKPWAVRGATLQRPRERFYQEGGTLVGMGSCSAKAPTGIMLEKCDPSTLSDLEKLENARRGGRDGSYRWYRKGKEPKCDFIDCSIPGKERYVRLQGVETKKVVFSRKVK